MAADHIINFDPWLLGAIRKAMGKLPAIPGDLTKIKSLTFFDRECFADDEGTLLNGWIKLASGDFSAIGKMPNLHTLLFKDCPTLKIGDFDFLRQCQKLKKLDLSRTDFSDCELLTELPNLQYVLLPGRWRLIHTQVLEHIQAQSETRPEMEERSRAKGRIDWPTPSSPQQIYFDTYTADPNLIYWLAVSLGKMPETPKDLAKVKLLDSLKRIPSLNISEENLPSWLAVKEGDFSLIGKLPDLQSLLLWNVVLDDFSFLSGCKELRYVNLWNTNFTDCRLLADLPHLHHIHLPEKGQLENFSLLVKRQDAWQRENQALDSPVTFFLETQRVDESGTADAKPSFRPASAERSDALPETDAEEAIYTGDDFKNLSTVRGEDVVISYKRRSKIRHVEARFCTDQTPPLWKVFEKVEEENDYWVKDNWAKLSYLKKRQLTNELLDSILKGNVEALYLSLEPWGEGHYFTVEFAGEWATVVYDADDEVHVFYESYNPAYTNPAELSPIKYDGQLPIPKMLALNDRRLVAEIVRHILATGQLLPGTLWAT